MLLLSWNVNGLRAVMKRGFLDLIKKRKPDVLCLQETKIATELAEQLSFPKSYRAYWNGAQKKGYAGTAILTRTIPLSVTYGLAPVMEDCEGRVINAEFEDFFLVNVYTPNSRRGLTRLDYRTGKWETAFRKHLKRLERKKPVVFCGDLNVAHQEIDLANPRANQRNAGFTMEERNRFTELLRNGFIDSFREFEQAGGHYSWWSYRSNARARNIGWRLDYFCISKSLKPRLQDAFIWPKITGSDHCPVGIVLQ